MLFAIRVSDDYGIYKNDNSDPSGTDFECANRLRAIGYYSVFSYTLSTRSAAFIDTLQLEQSEYDLIKFPERGTCLYRCGNERYLLVVIAPPYKAALFGSAGGR